MKIVLLNGEGYQDISPVATSVAWSGALNQAARKLEVSLAVSPHDHYLPQVKTGLGNMLKLHAEDGRELLKGFIFSRELSYNGSELQLTAYDGLIYLTKSQMSYNFQNMTAEAITAKVCGDLGIIPGHLIATGVTQSYIAQAKTGYDIIMTAYTKASRQTGKKYLAMMNQGRLDVIEVGAVAAHYTLNNQHNLTHAGYTETIENMVNRVIITDDQGNRVGQVQNDQWMKDYGLLQAVCQKEPGKNPDTAARSMLKDRERQASIEALGNTGCLTGKAVMITEPYTGLTQPEEQKMFIINDTHTWSDGKYTMSLALEYEAQMDEKEG